MDLTRDCKREPNPVEDANIVSRLVFFFTCGLFRRGLRKNLGEEDIYKPMKRYKATLLGSKLERFWKKQPKKNAWRFFWCMLKMIGVQYIYLFIALLLIDVPINMVKPILKGKIIAYFSKNNTEISDQMVYCYTAMLIASCVAASLFFNGFIYIIEQITLKLKIAICSLLYRKSLKLNSTFTSKNASGQAITLITKDIDMLDFAFYVMPKLIEGIVNVSIMVYMMYLQIGVSAFSGTLTLIAVLPVQVFVGKLIGIYRRKTARATESRVRITQEILTAVRIIKMYTWELFFSKSVEALRKKEIRNLRFLFYIKETAFVIGHLNTKLALYVSIMTYMALGNYITAEKAFIVVGCFATLSVVFSILTPWGIAKISEMKTAIQRFTAFLNSDEITNICYNSIGEKEEPNICIKDVEVKCDDTVILNNLTLVIKSRLTLITGSIGSGKSTFLKLLLGDVNKNRGTVDVIGKMSYASQEPWLFPGTVRQNIIFNEPFDRDRYEIVVNVCALQKDFQDLSNGDRTYLTDRGLNLSRGQKTRINLARAVYNAADIYLLDDCLSAVDPHVANHIFYECIKGFLKDKMCILVTHQEHFLKDADDIIVLNEGSVVFHGDYDSIQKSNKEYFESITNETKMKLEELKMDGNVEKTVNEFDNVDESSQLLLDMHTSTRNIYQEDAEEGAIKKKVYLEYFRSGGGIKMVILVLGVAGAAQVASSWSEYFVSFWVDMEEKLSGFRYNGTTNSTEFKELEESHDSLMVQYSLVMIAALVLAFLKVFVFYILTCKAALNIHNAILKKLINAGMPFFDKNLSGNIMNRLSRDLGILDEQLASTISEVLAASMTLLGVLFVISSVNTIFLIPSFFFMVVLYFIRRLYLPTARSVRRLEGATRSPVIGQFNATLDGLTTIRASQAESLLTEEFEKHLDTYNSAVHMHISTSRAFSLWVNLVCDFYISLIIITFLFFSGKILAGKVGLAISQAFILIGWLQWGVREWAEFENKMTSAERVLEYKKIEEEDKSGNRISNWPHSGRIIYHNISLCYSDTSETVLKDVNFIINSKNKIGIVGRTGAGKTSIISTLFRLYDFEGMITIDDVDTKSVAVELLRSKISIIPQDPILFSGTIRSNLDPNDEYTDKQLWDALEEVELKSSIESLHDEINEGGGNFSIGEKQLICLARAIVRNNIVLVLDEATANMDSQTDAVIQKTIKRNFGDCTVITIAHRINTIIDSDKVLVMDSGRVIEYDNPRTLLSETSSTFYKMARDAGVV